MNYLETLDKLHPDIVHHFLQTGESKGIPEEVQLFLKQIQYAAEIYEYERNISRAAKKLRIRILTEQKIDVPVRTCKSRIYSALNYFNIDNNVAVKVWENDFADKYQDLAKLAISNDDLRTAKACYDAARDCRIAASEAAARESDWAPVFIISPEITAEQMGFAKESLKVIAKKNNEGYYINLIDSLPVDKKEKKRLLADADIEDAEMIEEELTLDDE
ncbi:MAG: hypothetical protein PHT14_07445 [Petrimonas sp.]|jgi:hypothetical protein|nr:hypothetical protein [Synergistaceae bacterium]MDD2312356.1 hypothetical protein [Petrimonas sp.]